MTHDPEYKKLKELEFELNAISMEFVLASIQVEGNAKMDADYEKRYAAAEAAYREQLYRWAASRGCYGQHQ